MRTTASLLQKDQGGTHHKERLFYTSTLRRAISAIPTTQLNTKNIVKTIDYKIIAN